MKQENFPTMDFSAYHSGRIGAKQQLAMYLRLSIEDRGMGESNSIASQRKQILEYVASNSELSTYEVLEFCDDGYSGTNMERPDMQRLLQEIKKNQIACVIVKDMSRFSRDYIELGTYLNQIFPFMGIRFIAINDHYDSRGHEGSTIEIDTAFQTLLYDLYSKDISIKMKATIQNKCENGEYVFGQTPFGYEKSKKEKNVVVVNEKEAEIVRYIFSMAVDGMSTTQIAKQLFKEGIPTTMQMRHSKRVAGKKNLTWNASMVRKILNNRFYLGEMIYGKSVMEAVGSKRTVKLPRENWQCIPEHHEPLVTPEIFAAAKGRSGHSTKRKREKHPLTGKLYCGGCGYSMNYKKETSGKPYRHFWCRKHSMLQIPDCCTYFNAPMLEEAILYMLNQELLKRGNPMKQVEYLEEFQKNLLDDLKKRWKSAKAQQISMKAEREGLYERYTAKQITAVEYRRQSDELSEQIVKMAACIQESEQKYNQLEKEYHQRKQEMKQIIRYSNLEELTQEVVDVFIKRIYVYKNKRVEIEWNFTDGSSFTLNGT